MNSLFTSIIKSIGELSPVPVTPSTEYSERTEYSDRTVPVSYTNSTPHRPRQNNNNIEPLISDMIKEIKKSEQIIEKDEVQIKDHQQIIKLRKCKDALNKLIQSLQNKIQAIQTHSITITDEIIEFLNESLKNIETINNICNKIYANKNVQPQSP